MVHGRSLIESLPKDDIAQCLFRDIYLHTFYEQHILLCGAYAK